MKTVAQAFQQFVSSLELTDAERAKADAQRERLRENVRNQLVTSRDFISGSYGRRTAIRPLNDIDIFCVLDAPAASAELAVGEVFDALRRVYPQSDLRRQSRSVNIDFKGTGIGFDIIPARTAGADYEIPDRKASKWIRTNPEKHREALVAANDRAGGKLNPLIKALKCWNVEHAKPLRSFHLEVMCYTAFAGPPTDYRGGATRLFEYCTGRIRGCCPDPACVGPDIDADMTESDRDKAYRALASGFETAQRAMREEAIGNVQAAHQQWTHLFGQTYAQAAR